MVETRWVIVGNASVCIVVCHARSLVLWTVLTNFNLSANTSNSKDVGLKSLNENHLLKNAKGSLNKYY